MFIMMEEGFYTLLLNSLLFNKIFFVLGALSHTRPQSNRYQWGIFCWLLLYLFSKIYINYRRLLLPQKFRVVSNFYSILFVQKFKRTEMKNHAFCIHVNAKS